MHLQHNLDMSLNRLNLIAIKLIKVFKQYFNKMKGFYLGLCTKSWLSNKACSPLRRILFSIASSSTTGLTCHSIYCCNLHIKNSLQISILPCEWSYPSRKKTILLFTFVHFYRLQVSTKPFFTFASHTLFTCTVTQ